MEENARLQKFRYSYDATCIVSLDITDMIHLKLQVVDLTAIITSVWGVGATIG